MPNARILPSGNYRCRSSWTDRDGIRHTKSFTAATKKEAERLAASFEASLYFSKDKTTVKEAMRAYINSRVNVLSPTTIRSYEIFYRSETDLHDQDVFRITQKDIQNCINSYTKDHSPKTVRNFHGFLVSVIHSIRPELMISTRLPQKRVYDAQIPEDSDVRKLLFVAEPELRKAIMLAAFGPMRRGEVLGLRYSDIKGDTIHIHCAKVKSADGKSWIIKPTPKTAASDRRVTLPRAVIEALGHGDGEIISYSPNGLYDAFKRACKAAGVASFRFHDLRHYGASILHSLGMPDAYIMERGGWETDETLKKVYRHALSDESKKYNDFANDHFAGLA